MKSQLTKGWSFYQTAFLFLMITLLGLAVFFRFATLEQRAYWDDEAITSLRISGYTTTELFQNLFDGHIVSLEELQKYQHLNPEKDLTDTINSLAIEDAAHPPLYYVICQLVAQGFPHTAAMTKAVTRTVAALISLLVFPGIYWLCRELFASSLVGWIAIALIAVSPFYVLYSQESREYSLWTVAILLSSAALLRAIRRKTPMSWGIYAATLALGLYSHGFHTLVAIGHGIYIIVTEKFRFSKTVIAYLSASVIGFLSFLPWIIAIFQHSHQVRNYTSWLTWDLDRLTLVSRWATNLNWIFFDFNLKQDLLFLSPIILTLVGYSIYFLWQKTPKETCLFIFILIAVTALALTLPDLILGGRRSTMGRYLTPCYLGIQLAIAFLLASKISNLSVNHQQQQLGKLVTIALISVGVISCTINSQNGWNKGIAPIYLRLVPLINSTPHPLLISDSNFLESGSRELSLSYLLEPKVKFLMGVEPNLPKIKIPDGFSDIFVFDPEAGLKHELETQNYKLKPLYEFGKVWLWEIEK